MNADVQPRAIDLAQEPAFELAGMEVRPATLEVVAGDRREQLEPRIMQVLVALARRHGEVVSRDELIASCWGGRIVGDDAINRCIGRLRKLAHTHGGFEIETVPRVGVRLVERAGAAPRGPRARRWVMVLAGILVAAVLGVAGWAWRHSLAIQAVPGPHLAVQTFKVIGDPPDGRMFAASLADQIAGVLGENSVGLVLQGPADAAGRVVSDMTMGGTVVRDGNTWRVRSYLEDRRTKLTLWSGQFAAPVGQEAALRDQVAAELADVAFSAVEPSLQPGLKLDPETLALYITASHEFANPPANDDQRPWRLLQQVVAQAPNFAAARAALSLNLANAIRDAAPSEREGIRRRAVDEARRAIRTNPSNSGAAYDALYMMKRLETPLDLASAEDQIMSGIAASTDSPWVSMRECRFLLEVGRAADALRFCKLARAIRPLAPPIDAAYARALYANGDLEKAVDAAEESMRFHPDHLQSIGIRFELAAFEGSPDRALALLHGSAPPRARLRLEDFAALELFLKARKSGAAADVDRAMTALWASRGPSLDHRYLILGAAKLGRLDDAFRALDQFGAAPPRSDVGVIPAVLLEPAAAPLWRDPRFWPVAAKAGYVRYWQTRDKWPDFCSEPSYPMDCRKEAARVARSQ